MGKTYSLFKHPDVDYEDLSFYKEYLSKFDVESAFEGCRLPALRDFLTKDDLFLFYRLVVASVASSYELCLEKEDNAVDIAITVMCDSGSATKKVQELSSSQIEGLFGQYLSEQLEKEYLQSSSEKGGICVDRQRRECFLAFEKKKRVLRYQVEGGDALPDMDELLNS